VADLHELLALDQDPYEGSRIFSWSEESLCATSATSDQYLWKFHEFSSVTIKITDSLDRNHLKNIHFVNLFYSTLFEHKSSRYVYWFNDVLSAALVT